MSLILVRTVFVVIGLTSLAFCLATAWLALRSPIRHRYWWSFVSLLAAPVMTMNWAGGKLSTSVLAVQLLGIGFQLGIDGASTWLSVAPPVGALLFRQRRRGLIRKHRPMLAENQLPDA